jgi:large subunit ribosomal protein L19e
MNLNKKKMLAVKTFGVGKKRIVFLPSRIEEIKEAITKQDLRDLKADGAILISEIHGRKTVVAKKRNKRSVGNVRKKVNKRKAEYVTLTRKLRSIVAEAKKQGKLNAEEVIEIRKKIRNKMFRSKANLKEHMGGLEK